MVKELPDDDTQGPVVSCKGDSLLVDGFRGDVVTRSRGAWLILFLTKKGWSNFFQFETLIVECHFFWRSEVAQHELETFIQKEVGGLDVSVHDVILSEVFKNWHDTCDIELTNAEIRKA